jgi:hypothetical protein
LDRRNQHPSGLSTYKSTQEETNFYPSRMVGCASASDG